MKRFARLMILLAAAGCAATDGTAPVEELVGTYTLATYNGEAVPAYVEPRLGACSSMIASGGLVVAAGGRATFTLVYSAPCRTGASDAADVRTGSVSVIGTAITVTLDANTLSESQVYTGTLAGGRLTLQFTPPNRTVPLVQTFGLVRQ